MIKNECLNLQKNLHHFFFIRVRNEEKKTGLKIFDYWTKNSSNKGYLLLTRWVSFLTSYEIKYLLTIITYNLKLYFA